MTSIIFAIIFGLLIGLYGGALTRQGDPAKPRKVRQDFEGNGTDPQIPAFKLSGKKAPEKEPHG